MLVLQRGSLPGAFGAGWLCGVVYFTGTLYWITHVMAVHGGMSGILAVLVNAALIAYLALFPAIFAVIIRRAYGAFGRRALVAVPFVWTASELGRTHLLTGFPWVLLGYSQVTVLPIAQLASVVGVFGLSALVAGVAAALAAAVITPGRARFAPPAAAAVLIVVIAGWGGARLAGSPLTAAGTPLRVALVQGNVDQAEKWDPARASEIFGRYLHMTREAVAAGAELILWPESSSPFRFDERSRETAAVRDIARASSVAILLGSDEIDSGVPTRYYNSAFLVGPDGSVSGSYRKMHLVPFGEYVPLKDLLFFAAPIVEAAGAFTPGASPELLEVRGRSMSTSICYEIVYPDLVRRFVADGSELLTTITNDAWFGHTSAPYQHFAQAAMRAIENGRYLVRSANTGISGIVDPYGRVVTASALFEPAVIVGEARFLEARTLYSRTGDVVGYASVLVTLGVVVLSRRRVQ